MSEGKITPEAVADLRGWMGRERRERGWNSAVTQDNVWHFAQGVGDDNPLWWDASYAAATRHGRMFAPPTFLSSCSSAGLWVTDDGIYPAQDWMPGTLPLWNAERWVFHGPAFVGDAIGATSDLYAVEESTTRDGAPQVNYTDRTSYRTGEGVLVAERFTSMTRRERKPAPTGGGGSGSASTAPAQPIETVYSDADLDRIAKQYDAEPAQRRGGATLYGDDVKVGDVIPTIVKGPLNVTNIVGWLLAWGSPLCQTNRILHQYLQKHPLAGLVNPRTNIADTIEGPHWDPDLALMSGMAGCYDFGAQRIAWVVHALTDWFGDDGFLAELEVRLRRPNFVGDTTWLSGSVTAVANNSDSVLVDCAVHGTNQRDEQSTVATAKVRLPARVQG